MIPEFLYRPGYDAKGRLIEISIAEGRRGLLQKGYREELLCDSCEGRLSRLEDYFARLWYNPPLIPDPITEDGIEISVDYKPFKLFLLSVLWRASVSSHEAFRTVRLGPFEEEARKMLLSSNPGPDTKFQVFACVYTIPGTHSACHGTIMPPVRSRGLGRRIAYEFIFGGAGWFFLVSKQVDHTIRSGALSESGTMWLPVDDLTSDRYFTEMFSGYLRNARRGRH